MVNRLLEPGYGRITQQHARQPNFQPIIGPVSGWEGVMLATDHTTKGIHLGPITGRIIAGYIYKGSTKVAGGIKSLLPDRLAGLTPVYLYASGQRVEE